MKLRNLFYATAGIAAVGYAVSKLAKLAEDSQSADAISNAWHGIDPPDVHLEYIRDKLGGISSLPSYPSIENTIH